MNPGRSIGTLAVDGAVDLSDATTLQTATTTDITIPAGEINATATFDVPLLDDDITEAEETFQVRITSVVAGTLGDTTAIATGRIDDDDRSSISIEDAQGWCSR